MSAFVKSVSSRTKNVVVGVIYTLLVLVAVFPPLYFSGSGVTQLFLGMPVAVWYWIVPFFLLMALMFGLYAVEKARGEVDPVLVTDGEGGDLEC